MRRILLAIRRLKVCKGLYTCTKILKKHELNHSGPVKGAPVFAGCPTTPTNAEQPTAELGERHQSFFAAGMIDTLHSALTSMR